MIESERALKGALFNCCKHNSRCLKNVQNSRPAKCRRKISDVESENKNRGNVYEGNGNGDLEEYRSTQWKQL
jgi:hypothetical protein